MRTLNRRCNKRLVAPALTLTLLLIAAPVPAQFTPSSVSITGHTGGFVAGAGVTLNATVMPAAPPNFTVIHQWYRGVAADGEGGTQISTATSYTTVDADRGFRIGLGARYLRTSDKSFSPETRATIPVGVRLAPWSKDNNEIGFVDNNAAAGRRAVLRSHQGQDPRIFTTKLLVQRRPASGAGDWTEVSTAAGNLASIVRTFTQSDIGLYSYRMCALRVAVAPRTVNSATLCFPVDNGNVVSPAAPVKLRAAAGDRRVRLEWTSPGPSNLIDRYQFRYATGIPAGFWINTGGSTTGHTVTGLVNGRSYNLEVRAVAEMAVRSTTYTIYGAAAFVSATPTVPPGAPAGLTASVGSGGITLSWQPPPAGESPTVYEYRSGGGCWAAVAASTTQIVASSTATGCTTLRVRAVNGDAPGPAVQLTVGTPGTSCSALAFLPALIDNLVLAENQAVSVTLPEGRGGQGGKLHALRPALPAGLSFDPATRVLSGTPAMEAAASTFIYSATDEARTDLALPFTITVNPALGFGTQTIFNQTYASGTPIADWMLPAATGGIGGKSYTLRPALPAGLSFDPATRVLSGTPAVETAASVFTYSATDETQSSITLPFTIAVSDDVRLRLRVFLEGPLR